MDNSKELLRDEGLKKQLKGLVLSQKPILTMDEAVMYTGLSKSYLYKLTYRKLIPHYKPTGKIIFFDRNELDKFFTTNQTLSRKFV